MKTKRIMKSVFAIFLCGMSLSLSAQTPAKSYPWSKHMKNTKMYMTKSIGVSFQDFTGLNERMAAFPQYKELRGHTFTISLGSMHVMNNFVSQLNVTGASSLTGDSRERSSAVRSIGGSFDLGYDVIPSARVMVYPMVGIGSDWYNAIFYKDVNAVSFNEVATSPTVQNNIRSVKFTNRFTTFRFGLGLAFASPDGNHSVGLQGFYSGSFKNNKDWKSSENQTLAGAPVDNLKRVSVGIVFTGNMMGMMHK
jgi:hypothetical protein